MFKTYIKYRKYFSIFFVLLLLFSFYQLGLSLPNIIALGIIFIALVLVREPIRQKRDKILNEKLSFLNNWPGWAKKLFAVLVFFLIYMALKQIIFFGLGLIGIDLREMILKSTGQF